MKPTGGQYGLTEKVVTKQNDKGELEVHTSIGTARIIRDSLPNATYIGFTGTPISSKDRSTREVFGDYIDIYDMTVERCVWRTGPPARSTMRAGSST